MRGRALRLTAEVLGLNELLASAFFQQWLVPAQLAEVIGAEQQTSLPAAGFSHRLLLS